MKKLISFALLALAACTYSNGRQPRSSDELARANDKGQDIAADTAMFKQQPAYPGDQPPVLRVYHTTTGTKAADLPTR